MRIHVIGAAGAGKSTLARHMAACLGIPHIELDALYWRPGWTKTSEPEFQAAVSARVLSPAWVIDGNYESVRELIWAAADMVIWLDYPLPLVLRRLIWRALRNLATRANLWGTDNYESWRRILSRDSVVLSSIAARKRLRNMMPKYCRTDATSEIRFVHLQSPLLDDFWFSFLCQLPPKPPGETTNGTAAHCIAQQVLQPQVQHVLRSAPAPRCRGPFGTVCRLGLGLQQPRTTYRRPRS